MPYKDKKKAKERCREYYITHSDTIKERTKKYRKEHPEKRREYNKRYLERHPGYNKKYHKEHIERAIECGRKWCREHPEQVRKIKNKSLKEHPEKRRESCREYHKNHVEQIKEYRKRHIEQDRKSKNKYNKRRRMTSMGRLNNSISSNVRQSLLGNKANGHWESLVGWTIEQGRKHFEGLFVQGMSWDNYGNKVGYWSIDHIKPISKYNFSIPEDLGFKQCWALSNLRPMWHIENIRKGNRA